MVDNVDEESKQAMWHAFRYTHVICQVSISIGDSPHLESLQRSLLTNLLDDDIPSFHSKFFSNILPKVTPGGYTVASKSIRPFPVPRLENLAEIGCLSPVGDLGDFH